MCCDEQKKPTIEREIEIAEEVARQYPDYVWNFGDACYYPPIGKGKISYFGVILLEIVFTDGDDRGRTQKAPKKDVLLLPSDMDYMRMIGDEVPCLYLSHKGHVIHYNPFSEKKLKVFADSAGEAWYKVVMTAEDRGSCLNPDS